MIRQFMPSHDPRPFSSNGGGLLDAFRARAAPHSEHPIDRSLGQEEKTPGPMNKKELKTTVGPASKAPPKMSSKSSGCVNPGSSSFPIAASSSSSGYSTTWADSHVASYSLTDMRVANKAHHLSKDTKGWRVNGDGVKEYTTFRNGQRVKATGAEAFRLAMGDNKVSKANKTSDICAIEGESDADPVAASDGAAPTAAKRKAASSIGDASVSMREKSDHKQAKISDSFVRKRVRSDEK